MKVSQAIWQIEEALKVSDVFPTEYHIDLRIVLADRERKAKALALAKMIIEHAAPGAFANGVSEYGLDEGEVLHGKAMDEIITALSDDMEL